MGNLETCGSIYGILTRSLFDLSNRAIINDLECRSRLFKLFQTFLNPIFCTIRQWIPINDEYEMIRGHCYFNCRVVTEFMDSSV